MKKYLLIATVALITSCATHENDGAVSTDSSATRTADTMMIGSKVFTFDTITKAEFEAVYKQNGRPEVFEGPNDDTAHVVIDSLQTRLHLQSGVDSVLISNYDENNYDNYIQYSYIRSLSEIPYWSFHVSMYEGGCFMIVSKQDGSQIDTWGEPLFAPNKQYFICNSFDLEAGFIANGFQFYTLSNGIPVLQWQKEFGEWGPSRICWKNNEELYIERSKRGESGYEVTFCRLKIK